MKHSGTYMNIPCFYFVLIPLSDLESHCSVCYKHYLDYVILRCDSQDISYFSEEISLAVGTTWGVQQYVCNYTSFTWICMSLIHAFKEADQHRNCPCFTSSMNGTISLYKDSFSSQTSWPNSWTVESLEAIILQAKYRAHEASKAFGDVRKAIRHNPEGQQAL